MNRNTLFVIVAVAMIIFLSAPVSAFAEDYTVKVMDELDEPVIGATMYAGFDFGEGFGIWILGNDLNNGKYEWADQNNPDAWEVILPSYLEAVAPDDDPHAENGETTFFRWDVIDWR